MVVPGGILGNAFQTLRWNGVPATRQSDCVQAIEVTLEIAGQRGPGLGGARASFSTTAPYCSRSSSFMRGS